MKRRHGLFFIQNSGMAMGVVAMLLWPAVPARAQGDKPPAGSGSLSRDVAVQEDGDPAVIPEPVVQSIRRGQEFLRNECAGRYYFRQTGQVGLGTLALMVDGSVPGRGPNGKEVALGVDFLLKKAQSTGLIYDDIERGTAPMYNHALATLCLAEVWGMTGQPEILPVLKRAVDLIVRCQNGKGGWRYSPTPEDADISVTVMQVVALRAAQNAGILVPGRTIQDAVRYVKGNACNEGGFGYSGPSAPLVPRSAAGVLSLQMCGEYEAKEARQGILYLQKHSGDFEQGMKHYYYAQYYAMQCMYQARESKLWNQWYAAQCKGLMARQKPTGSWDQSVVDTSFAILAMGLPYRYLPIYQR